MNIWYRWLVLISLAIVLSGCASGPKFQQYSEQLSPLSDDQTRVFIYRPGSGASSVNPGIKIDGKTVGQVPAKSFIVANIKPGGRLFTTTANPRVVQSIYVKKGAETYIRLTAKKGFTVNEVKASMVKSEIARSEIAETTYAGP